MAFSTTPIQVERVFSDAEVSDSSTGPQNRASQLHNHARTSETAPSRRGNNWNEADSLLLIRAVARPANELSIEIDAQGILKVARNIQICVICLI